ncbi:TetR/AcrR family transcriptional regulator [Nocardiopsis potens]|uniref:TetR/AcrR family transcriptional regulator n=1 Tax=Nocardiopsis potens TaxID=1246458 RepID=UPI000374D63E|nr:TetR/AcrR family transcriptional regulator [Nocardiopsis potens]
MADDAPTIENGAPPAERPGAPGGPGAPGRRSRRRGEALNTAIFEAVLAELAETGYARMTMERVAERAKAGKASLYRRWPNRARLVMDALYHLMPSPERPADTGSFRGDLLALLRSTARLLDGPAGEAMRGLLSEALVSPEQGTDIRALSRGAGVATMRTLAERAAARGEIDPAAITERRLEAGQAMMRHHFLFHGPPISDPMITGIVDEVVLPLFASPPPAGGGDPAG